MLQKLVGRFRSDLACSAAGNKDATPTLRYGWRLIHECVEAVAGDLGLKKTDEGFSVHGGLRAAEGCGKTIVLLFSAVSLSYGACTISSKRLFGLSKLTNPLSGSMANLARPFLNSLQMLK